MENKINEEKSFINNNLLLENRKLLKLTGVEKVFETNETKIQVKVSGNLLTILGSALSVEKLDVNSGILEISGEINELKFSNKPFEKTNFIKKIFK